MIALVGWLISFFNIIAIIMLIAYQLMCLADLEFDYTNPYDSATRINQVVYPEIVAQGCLFLVFLFTGHFLMALICVPYLYYNVKSYMDNRHLVDVTEIFNNLSWEKKKRFIKLGYLLATLFLSLFWLIWSALEDDENLYEL